MANTPPLTPTTQGYCESLEKWIDDQIAKSPVLLTITNVAFIAIQLVSFAVLLAASALSVPVVIVGAAVIYSVCFSVWVLSKIWDSCWDCCNDSDNEYVPLNPLPTEE